MSYYRFSFVSYWSIFSLLFMYYYFRFLLYILPKERNIPFAPIVEIIRPKIKYDPLLLLSSSLYLYIFICIHHLFPFIIIYYKQIAAGSGKLVFNCFNCSARNCPLATSVWYLNLSLVIDIFLTDLSLLLVVCRE